MERPKATNRRAGALAAYWMVEKKTLDIIASAVAGLAVVWVDRELPELWLFGWLDLPRESVTRAVVVFVVTVAGAWVLVYLVALLVAPFSQRNELRREVKRLVGRPTIDLDLVGRVVPATPRIQHKFKGSTFLAMVRVTNNAPTAVFWAEGGWANSAHPRWSLGWGSYDFTKTLNQGEDADLFLYVVDSFKESLKPPHGASAVFGDAIPISDLEEIGGHKKELRPDEPLRLIVRMHAKRGDQRTSRDFVFDVALDGKPTFVQEASTLDIPSTSDVHNES